MPRLDQFFDIRPGQQKSFNPFDDYHTEPKRTEDVVKMIEKENAKLNNVLDASPHEVASSPAPDGSNQETVLLFPQKRANPTPVPQEAVADGPIVPMIQPRSKDGQRLLYKHPAIPRVGPRGAYWLLVGQSDRSEAAWLLQFDGAANPNPGPASSGAILWSPKEIDGTRRPVFEMGKYLGKATNNIAEAQGLLLGLKMAAVRGARELLIEGDSELIVFHNTGKYRVSDKNLKVWWSESQAAMMDETCFDWIAIRQVPREQNERADSITKEVLSRKEGFQR
jgi:ribonuclease HI